MTQFKSVFSTSLLCLTLASNPASADLQDLLIGGAIGAVVMDQVHKNKNRNQPSPAPVQTNTVVQYVEPSLNSQYNEQERIAIQQSLNSLGFAAGDVDGVLGPQSRNAISLYQASLGQDKTGQLTGGQYASLTTSANGQPLYAENRVLRHDEIMMLQEGLNKLGYFYGDINGVAGPGTNGALTAYLVNQQVEPGTINPVQALVMVENSAGSDVPEYLVQEANMQALEANQG